MQTPPKYFFESKMTKAFEDLEINEQLHRETGNIEYWQMAETMRALLRDIVGIYMKIDYTL